MKIVISVKGVLGGEGRNPGRSHILRLAGPSGVSGREADSIIAEVQAAVDRWNNFAAQAGVSSADLLRVSSIFPRLGRPIPISRLCRHINIFA